MGTTSSAALSADFTRLKALYTQVEEAAGLGVWEWDTRSGRVTWSAGLYKIYAVDPGRFEPSYEAYLKLLHPEDRGRTQESIERALRDKSIFSNEERVVLADGSTRHIHTWGRPVRDAAGRVTGLVGVCQDVTAIAISRQRASTLELKLKSRIEANAAELAFTSALLSAEQEASLDGILVVDPEGRILTHNRRFSELWGIPEEVMATGSDERALDVAVRKLVEPEVFLRRVRWLYTHPLEKSFEEVKLRDGRTFERYSSPILDGQKVLGRVWYFRDISARARAELSAKAYAERLARSNADLEMYAAAAAHDLSAPLRRISVFADLLDDRYGRRMEPADREILSRITDNANRLSALIQALLTLSRVGHAEQELAPVHLGPLLSDVLSELAVLVNEAAAEIVVGPLPVVRAHWALMDTLFQNLLSNAIKFRGEGRNPRIEIGSRVLPDGGVEMHVDDNGIGFEQSRAREIFEPFHRLHGDDKFKGAGIGLTICQRIALRYGWRLSAAGRPGRGARFTLTVPAASVVRPSA